MEKIILLGGSYVSSLLLETARLLKIGVYGVDARAEEDIRKAGIVPLTEKEAAAALQRGAIAYTNAEDTLPFLRLHSSNRLLLSAIGFFKDKANTRKLSNELSGRIFFEEVDGRQLDGYVPPAGKKLVIKPSCGFHSLGVRNVSSAAECKRAAAEIRDELESFSGSFDKSVVNGEKFIVEEYLEGDEYACDAFFGHDGLPVITGIYKHEFADKDDVRDCVYYTSSEVLDGLLPRVEKLLCSIAQKTHAMGMPIHFEFRICGGALHLIEVNPMRFGGFGLADLAYYAYGANPYEVFFLAKRPCWGGIIGKMGRRKYAFVVGQAPHDRKAAATARADFAAFKKTFPEILSFTPLDFTKYSFFATAITASEDLNELRKYLFFNYETYFHADACAKEHI